MNSSPNHVALIVEDEVIVRIMTADIMSGLGWTVLEAGDGSEALALMAERGDITLLVADIAMPTGMDGLELARAAADLYPGLAVLIVSGREEPTSAGLPSRTRFLPKPFSDRGLIWAIDEVMNMP